MNHTVNLGNQNIAELTQAAGAIIVMLVLILENYLQLVSYRMIDLVDPSDNTAPTLMSLVSVQANLHTWI